MMRDAGFGKGEERKQDKKVRGDKFIWLSKMIDTDHEEASLKAIASLVYKLNVIRDIIDEEAKVALDDREIQLAVYEGKGEYYLRHKDAFKIDVNNLKDGQKLRKVTVIAYLNPTIPEIKKRGELRLYLPDKIVDIMAR